MESFFDLKRVVFILINNLCLLVFEFLLKQTPHNHENEFRRKLILLTKCTFIKKEKGSIFFGYSLPKIKFVSVE